MHRTFVVGRDAYLSTFPNEAAQMVGSGVWPFWMSMLVQVVNNACVGIDDLFHVLWAHFVFHPSACAGYQAFRLEFVCVEQVST